MNETNTANVEAKQAELEQHTQQKQSEPTAQHEQMIVSVPMSEYLDLVASRKALLILKDMQVHQVQPDTSERHVSVGDVLADIQNLQSVIEGIRDEAHLERLTKKVIQNTPPPNSP